MAAQMGTIIRRPSLRTPSKTEFTVHVLVTGGAGFIGSHLVERLLDDGHRVVALDNFDDFYARSLKEGNLERAADHSAFSLVEGDIRDSEVLSGLPEVDTVVHLAALAGVRRSIERSVEYHDVNVSGTVSLLEFAKDRGVRRFLFGSSSSIYGNNERVPFSEGDPVDHPISPYAATKKAAELTCHAYHHLYGIGVLCVRFFTVYGPRQRPDLAIHGFTQRMHEGQPITLFGDGSTERDYTYVDDIIEGVVRGLDYLLESPGSYEILNLAGGRTITLSRMVETIAATLGVKPEILRLPDQPGDVRRTIASIDRAARLIGYAPTVDFETGVRRFVEWYMDGSRGT